MQVPDDYDLYFYNAGLMELYKQSVLLRNPYDIKLDIRGLCFNNAAVLCNIQQLTAHLLHATQEILRAKNANDRIQDSK